MQHCSRFWRVQSDAMWNSFLKFSLFRLLTNELNSLIWAKMSTDEYLSSPILQSQRVWCEGNVILMRPTDPAPSGSQTLTNYLVPLSSTHTWLCRALRCGQIFVLSPVSLVMMINDQSRPLMDHPIRENWQDGFNFNKTARYRWAINNFVSRVFLLFVFR